MRADEALATHSPERLLQTLRDPEQQVPLAAREVPVFLGNGDADAGRACGLSPRLRYHTLPTGRLGPLS